MPGSSIMYENLPKLKATPPFKKRKAISMLVTGLLVLSVAVGSASASIKRGLPGHIIETPRAFTAV